MMGSVKCVLGLVCFLLPSNTVEYFWSILSQDFFKSRNMYEIIVYLHKDFKRTSLGVFIYIISVFLYI